jgi:alpha-glucosidase
MQWDASPNAGFTTPDATPWLPVAADAGEVNVAGQAEDPDSMLTLSRRLIALRREHPMLATGDFEPFGPTPSGTYAFRRMGADGRGRLTVALNLTGDPRHIPDAGPGRVLIGTHRDCERDAVSKGVDLRPNEAVVIEER